MNTMLSSSKRILFTLVLIGPVLLFGRGMPQEQRDTIHGLFDSHEQFERTVTITEDGYVAKTTSENPEAVRLIQAHVKQMEVRLKEGLRVRSWDPAYVEFVNHYHDIDIQITNISDGVSIVTVGKTDAAKAVARNHAGIISKFIEHGWKEHDKSHAAVFEDSESDGTASMEGMKSCCAGKESGEGGMSCSQDGESERCMMEAAANTDGSSSSMACCRKAG